ncbi:hypothetical protein RGQ21_02520 [Kitasatospora aureofaciens]|nr:hypothetical protein RGQ21_02520 [Kitasatospora aureofaciens]
MSPSAPRSSAASAATAHVAVRRCRLDHEARSAALCRPPTGLSDAKIVVYRPPEPTCSLLLVDSLHYELRGTGRGTECPRYGCRTTWLSRSTLHYRSQKDGPGRNPRTGPHRPGRTDRS